MFTPEEERTLRKPEYIFWRSAWWLIFWADKDLFKWQFERFHFPSISCDRDDEIIAAFLRNGYKRISLAEKKGIKEIWEEMKRRRDDINDWIDSMEKKFRFSSMESIEPETIREGNLIQVNFKK
jgi:hypothetical protein